jgi:uncharacterized repeat protein (TIGR03806 family)
MGRSRQWIVVAPALVRSTCRWLTLITLHLGCQSQDGAAPATGGPFGLTTRPHNPDCRPPASYDQPPTTLVASGCADPKDPTRPSAGMIPYGVASPLWSDGASKRRFLALPDGARIHVKDCAREPATCGSAAQGGTPDDDGHFSFPVGSVLRKDFLFQQRPFETRLFMKFTETRWVGYSYQWNAAHTDATVVGEDGHHEAVQNDGGAMQDWAFPSRSDCLLCHNDVVGFALGLETRQLDGPFDYPSGVTANQVDTLEHIGLFDAKVARPALLTDPADSRAALDDRVRSYLHINCAICHRPEGKFPGIDLRLGVPLAATGLCNQAPTKGSAGAAPPALRLVPGHPEQSVTYTRVATLDQTIRMPQVATAVVDPLGTALLSDWIKGIAACP